MKNSVYCIEVKNITNVKEKLTADKETTDEEMLRTCNKIKHSLHVLHPTNEDKINK